VAALELEQRDDQFRLPATHWQVRYTSVVTFVPVRRDLAAVRAGGSNHGGHHNHFANLLGGVGIHRNHFEVLKVKQP
jgi:hypothetical protein